MVVLAIPRTTLVTIDIFYYLPDYQHIIQEFVWQTQDVTPELYRVHKFLNHWHTNIKAMIERIEIAGIDKDSGYSLRHVDKVYLI